MGMWAMACGVVLWHLCADVLLRMYKKYLQNYCAGCNIYSKGKKWRKIKGNDNLLFREGNL